MRHTHPDYEWRKLREGCAKRILILVYSDKVMTREMRVAHPSLLDFSKGRDACDACRKKGTRRRNRQDGALGAHHLKIIE